MKTKSNKNKRKRF